MQQWLVRASLGFLCCMRKSGVSCMSSPSRPRQHLINVQVLHLSSVCQAVKPSGPRGRSRGERSQNGQVSLLVTVDG
ncbi:hypothetical protein F5X97DRAFT_299367 [Nemania serpens]|nr:hypothetical protein F5X97DRAFT_299367 [Nemania serpens]